MEIPNSKEVGRLHYFQMLILLEPMMNQVDIVTWVCKKLSLALIFFLCVNPTGKSGGIALFWRSEMWVEIKRNARFFIEVTIILPGRSTELSLIVVYASVNDVVRRK